MFEKKISKSDLKNAYYDFEEKKRKITERLQSTANDIAMQNPTSPLFDFLDWRYIKWDF